MKKLIYSVLTAAVICSTQVFAMTTGDSATSANNASHSGQEQTSSDQSHSRPANGSSYQLWGGESKTYKKPDIKVKDPRDYSKTDH
ncbi:MAG: hypothetical protein K0U68_05865 [Gammaproteobacteria bacterium]|nr:hypothetical protein [Gammaproteobacteria bacterium]